MGVYSTNQTHLGSYSSDAVVANENYVGEVGAFHIMMENSANDQAIFEAVIGNDFKDAALARTGVVNESTEAVLEASGSFVDKIKEFLTKCWEKIKGVFKSLLTKINNVIVRDNKEFVNKYKKEVLTKDLSKMKYKWAAKKKDIESPGEIDAIDKEVTTTVAAIYNGSVEEIKKVIEDNGDLVDSFLSGALESNTTAGDFAKDFHEKYFQDEDTEEGLSTSLLSEIMNDLTEGKGALKALTKLQKDVDKLFNTRLKQIDKARTATAKRIPEKGDSEGQKKGKDALMQAHNAAYKVVSVEQTGTNKVISCTVTEVKFWLKQCRRVFAQAAAYNPKAVKESAVFVEAAGQAAEYELESSFADYSM
jgi:hypothetical protein